ncbi:MAG TPA: cytochrome c-type biogenesis protein [Gemmatimonadota bacterium]|nr:cytochrome c-type biogenesis protein [Gemmatimonadota bacterium]
MRCRRIAILALLSGVLAQSATAQTAAPGGEASVSDPAPAPVALTPEQEELAAEIESMLKCPVCRSQSVRTSRSFMAEDMSRRIRQMVAEGKSKEEIREYFVARYGDYIVLAPRKEGFTWTVWLLPFALVLGGAVTIVAVARRWRGTVPPPPPPARSSADTYMQRLEQELEETE